MPIEEVEVKVKTIRCAEQEDVVGKGLPWIPAGGRQKNCGNLTLEPMYFFNDAEQATLWYSTNRRVHAHDLHNARSNLICVDIS
jgi:hypothetical protein